MEKKYSIIVNHRNGMYVAVFSAWTENEEGQKTIIDTQTVTNIASPKVAIEKANGFIDKNNA